MHIYKKLSNRLKTMLLNVRCLAPYKWTTQKHQYRQNFQRNWKSLQLAEITELTETMFSVSTVRMYHQQQAFRSLANRPSIVD